MEISSNPADYCCPITLEVMKDPYILVQSGHTYEKEAIEEALKHRPNVDPKTNKRFKGKPHLLPNHTLRGLISWLIEQEHGVYFNPPTINQNQTHEVNSNSGVVVDIDYPIMPTAPEMDPDPVLDRPSRSSKSPCLRRVVKCTAIGVIFIIAVAGVYFTLVYIFEKHLL